MGCTGRPPVTAAVTITAGGLYLHLNCDLDACSKRKQAEYKAQNKNDKTYPTITHEQKQKYTPFAVILTPPVIARHPVESMVESVLTQFNLVFVHIYRVETHYCDCTYYCDWVLFTFVFTWISPVFLNPF